MKKTVLIKLTSPLNKGFTLVELLVVIALIGVMAVAVLSAINPIEQVNKGADTGVRSDTEQLLGAIDRYYSVHQFYPWQSGTTDITHADLTGTWTLTPRTCTTSAPAGSICELEGTGGIDANGNVTGASGLAGYQPPLSQLVATNEVKSGFKTRLQEATREPIYLHYNSAVSGATPYGCFKPKSRAFALEAKARCESMGSNPTGSPFDQACYGDYAPGGACGFADAGATHICMICLP